MKTKSLTVFAFLIFIAGTVSAQQTYTLLGTVYDSTSNQPVEGAQVWLHGVQKGDITNQNGLFKFKIFKERSRTRTYVRICGEEIAASKLIDFDSDSLIKTEFLVGRKKRNCQSPPNIPWKINPAEAKTFSGHYILTRNFMLTRSGGYIETCHEDSYYPAWTNNFSEKELWSSNSKLGDRVFIRFKGSLDPYSENVVPFQTIYVGKIDKIREPTENDCSN